MKNIIQYLQSNETKERIVSLINDNILLYQGINTDNQIQKYTGLIYNQFVKECVQNNQYVSLSNQTINAINDTYKELVLNLRKISIRKYDIDELRAVVDKHRNKLISVIEKNDYEDKKDQLFIPCSEYTGEFQNEILRTDLHQLNEPIIDVGCGMAYELIKLLRRNGYSEVYGLDQYVSNDQKIVCSNWFDYKFQKSTWGTIIAHMSFSNHLRRSLINNDDYKEIYVEKYFEMLHSLKSGGMFIYTPSVKKLEDDLNRAEYEIQYFRNLNDSNLDTVYIRKLL